MKRFHIQRCHWILIVVLSVFWLKNVSYLEASEKSKEKIVEAIQGGADYAANVLLDENGKSRCEYNILAGKWQDYEPAWHTGQIIYALTRAYEITNDRAYLDSAKKAGDWWLSLEIKDHPKLRGMVKAIHGAGVDYIIFSTVTDGTAGFKQNIERSLKWTLKNRFPQDHPDKNLAGGFLELRAKSKQSGMVLINRDIGTAFCIRFLCDYFQYFYGEGR